MIFSRYLERVYNAEVNYCQRTIRLYAPKGIPVKEFMWVREVYQGFDIRVN